jgi:hypothetical protein
MTTDDHPLDVDQLEARLTSHGVYVTDAELDGATVALAYESIAADETGGVPHREAGRVINVVRDLLDADESVGVEATVTDLDGETRGTWRMDPAWLDALEAGDLSEVEFSGKVIDTIEQG